MNLLLAATCQPASNLFNTNLYNGIPWNTSSCSYQITTIDQLPLIIANIIEILLALIVALAVVFVIYAGIQYITSSGDSSRTASAKSTLTYAVVGVILSGAAYLVVSFLAGRFS
jgi:cation transporter-like permease